MDFWDVLRSRRSVRSYRPDPVPAGMVDRVLEAGILAPSAGNRQPWEFVVVQEDAALKQEIVNTTYRGNSWRNGQTQAWLLEAPVLIVVCANVPRTVSRYGWETGHRLIREDISAAVENMLLAAVALGLGSCWIGGFDPVALSAALALPEMLAPLAVLPLGYPAAAPPGPPKLALDAVVHARR